MTTTTLFLDTKIYNLDFGNKSFYGEFHTMAIAHKNQ